MMCCHTANYQLINTRKFLSIFSWCVINSVLFLNIYFDIDTDCVLQAQMSTYLHTHTNVHKQVKYRWTHTLCICALHMRGEGDTRIYNLQVTSGGCHGTQRPWLRRSERVSRRLWFILQRLVTCVVPRPQNQRCSGPMRGEFPQSYLCEIAPCVIEIVCSSS